jgi:hypothetical protein
MTSNLDLRQVRAIVTDADVLGRLDPATVAAYLERSGWVRAHERANGAIWTRWLSDRAVKVFAPNDPTIADFALRMGALLGALAVAEDRSQLAVLADLFPSLLADPEGLRRENRELREKLDASAGHTADECEADAIQAEYERLATAAQALVARLDDLEAAWRSPGQDLEVAAHQLREPTARATVAVLNASNAVRAALAEEIATSDG